MSWRQADQLLGFDSSLAFLGPNVKLHGECICCRFKEQAGSMLKIGTEDFHVRRIPAISPTKFRF